MQNSVDAVRELKAHLENTNTSIDDVDLIAQDSDVLIKLEKRDDGSCWVVITDKGIGMTADTVQNYFLKAGASFRNSDSRKMMFLE